MFRVRGCPWRHASAKRFGIADQSCKREALRFSSAIAAEKFRRDAEKMHLVVEDGEGGSRQEVVGGRVGRGELAGPRVTIGYRNQLANKTSPETLRIVPHAFRLCGASR